MNWHHQIIKTTPAHLFLLSLLVLSFCATCNVGKTVVARRKNITCIDQERDALLKFKHHIQSDYCGLLSSWGNSNAPDCCTWKGVSCSNQSGHIIGLNLRGAPDEWGCLDSPVVSPSLGELNHLKYLDLSSNDFDNMDIPSSIGSLVNLIHLNLSNSGFNGNIPNQLGNLTSLTSLDLSNNYGISAKSLNWVSRLSLLRDINLSGTNLSEATDWTQSIGSLPLLEFYWLPRQFSRFNGNIPHQLGNLTRLKSLDLSSNYGISAKSLNWLSQLSLLRDINLSGIDLSEATDWPQSIGSLPMLEVLKMDGCQLSTPLTTSSLTTSSLLSANLRIVSLSGNNFNSSSIFQWLFNNSKYSSAKQSLEYLDLSYNTFQGPIPNEIGNLKFLAYLNLSRNSFSRIVPDAMGNMEFLKYLDLSLNSLSSTIPDEIGNLQSLMYMDLSYNSLSGSIPSTLGFSGALGTMHSLSYLDLSHNRLEGFAPGDIGPSLLLHLDISYNLLQGSIPSAIGDLNSIVHIDLSYNHLQGPIPSSLGEASSLSYLDFSNNHLEGAIPISIANLEYLGYLDLSNNYLRGDIPCKLEITNTPYLAKFSNNDLSGSIPIKLSFLGYNAFQGNPNFHMDEFQGPCDDDKHDKDKIYPGLYVSIGLGFYTGFWVFCGTLTLKNSWRHAYFGFLDHMIDNIYVVVAVYLARFRRKSQV
ncbi:uncharacterized protein LOC141620889 [Silene latifolia]|uniref:uncharacterized protein LOC141620889 n=1 Tax=Silene latifolia TaxID=37657 RepID=UPI003D76EBEC